MSPSLVSRYSSFLRRLHLWLLGNELPARISSAFTAIPLPTIKGYLDNQSANSSRRCLLVGAMKDYMSPWLAVHLTPQGSRPIGTRKSGGAISMAKEGLCVMQQWGACGGGFVCGILFTVGQWISVENGFQAVPRWRHPSVYFLMPSVSNSVIVSDMRFDLDSCLHEESRLCDMI